MPVQERKLAEKVVAVISIIGTERVSEVYRYLRESETKRISLELTRLPELTADELGEITQEFYNYCVAQKAITEGGRDHMSEALERAFGSQQAKVLMERVARSLQSRSFDFIRKVDAKTLMSLFQNEHLQTPARILSYTTPEQLSKMIASLPQETRVDAVEGIVSMDRALPMAIKIVEEVLRKKIGSASSEETTEVGGLNFITDVMNHVDRGTERDIFGELGMKNPQLAEDVRKLMFVFEDIAYLDLLSIQRSLREVDSKDLAMALKAANKEVSSATFANMSTRARENIQDDIEHLHNIRMRGVEEAQQRIVASIRRLEEEGETVIVKDGKDELIVQGVENRANRCRRSKSGGLPATD